MDKERAAALLKAERERVTSLLEQRTAIRDAEKQAAGETGDWIDRAVPLTSEEINDALAKSLRARLDAVGRAEKRLANGTYGLSVRSGVPIPEERLEADPTAELTVEEARRP